MIDLYTAATPNGHKISIALEELGLPYEAHFVDIMQNQTWTPDYLSLNPNGKIPAILDPDGPGGAPLALFESGAILGLPDAVGFDPAHGGQADNEPVTASHGGLVVHHEAMRRQVADMQLHIAGLAMFGNHVVAHRMARRATHVRDGELGAVGHVLRSFYTCGTVEGTFWQQKLDKR